MSRFHLASDWRNFSLKLTFEVLVIVAGILIALAISDWDGNRKDRHLEQEYLQRLFIDVDTNLQLAQELRQYHGNVVKNARRVYPLIKSGIDIDEEPLMIITRAFWASAIWPPDWIDSTHQELLSTGRYELLRNADLRRALLEYYGYSLENDQMLRFASTAYRDAIRSEIDAELQIAIRTECERFEDSCDITVDSGELLRLVDWLRSNDELARNITRVILQSYRVDHEYMSRVVEDTTSLKEMIEAELEPGYP